MSIIGDQLKPVLDKLSEDERALILAAIEGATTSGTAIVGLAADDIHGILDRLNGTRLAMTDGGFELKVPPRKP